MLHLKTFLADVALEFFHIQGLENKHLKNVLDKYLKDIEYSNLKPN